MKPAAQLEYDASMEYIRSRMRDITDHQINLARMATAEGEVADRTRRRVDERIAELTDELNQRCAAMAEGG